MRAIHVVNFMLFFSFDSAPLIFWFGYSFMFIYTRTILLFYYSPFNSKCLQYFRTCLTVPSNTALGFRGRSHLTSNDLLFITQKTY